MHRLTCLPGTLDVRLHRDHETVRLWRRACTYPELLHQVLDQSPVADVACPVVRMTAGRRLPRIPNADGACA